MASTPRIKSIFSQLTLVKINSQAACSNSVDWRGTPSLSGWMKYGYSSRHTIGEDATLCLSRDRFSSSVAMVSPPVHARPLTYSWPRISETEHGVGNFILAFRRASLAVKKSLASQCKEITRWPRFTRAAVPTFFPKAQRIP